MSQVAGHQAQNMNAQPSTGSNMTLDPSDWKNFRLQAHDMLKVNQSQYVYIEDSTLAGADDNTIDFVAVQRISDADLDRFESI